MWSILQYWFTIRVSISHRDGKTNVGSDGGTHLWLSLQDTKRQNRTNQGEYVMFVLKYTPTDWFFIAGAG